MSCEMHEHHNSLLLLQSMSAFHFLLLIRIHTAYRCQRTCAIPSTSHTRGENADVPPLICAIVPHCMLRKMLPLFPEMSQMLLTLLHRREHLTLTQCSSGLCLICIGALFSFSRQTPHWCASPSHWLEETNSNTDPHPVASMRSPEVMK